MERFEEVKKRVKRVSDGIEVTLERGCIVLRGELDNYEDILRAGFAAVDKKLKAGVVNELKLKGFFEPERRPEISDSLLEGARPDVLVIGGGVVGAAILRELSRFNLDLILIEKEYDLAVQASSRNDGVVHAGIDLKSSSEKYKYLMAGNDMFDDLCRDLKVEYSRAGQYILVRKRKYLFFLPLLFAYAKKIGVPLEYVSRKKLRELQPAIAGEVWSACFLPRSGRVSPYQLTVAYAENAVENGARVALDTMALSMDVEDGVIKSVLTNRGRIFPRLVINAAGVFADRVARMADDQFFTIHPRKGTNCILDLKAGRLTDTTLGILGSTGRRSKSKHTKGGGVVRTVEGNILVGPDARETPYREDFSTSKESIDAVFEKHSSYIPSLRKSDIITYFSGIRAATYEEDFVIGAGRFTKNILHAAGIQSPGLTAAPAIGTALARLAHTHLSREMTVTEKPDFNPVRKALPRLATLSRDERAELIRRNPDYGKIVCRCEEVSRGEILDALNSPVPVYSLDAVRRRARAGAGRCQGGFCGPIVAEIIAEAAGIPLSAVTKRGAGTEILTGALPLGREQDNE